MVQCLQYFVCSSETTTQPATVTFFFVQVLRGKATEPAGVRKATGGFDDFFEKGTYVCAGGWVGGWVGG